MLVVSRKSGESILIGENIEIFVLEIGDNFVKIGINAPKNIRVLRKELLKEVSEQNIQSMNNIEKIIKIVK
jgi:carbon storage regulator